MELFISNQEFAVYCSLFALIAEIVISTGFVRSGLGFGGDGLVEIKKGAAKTARNITMLLFILFGAGNVQYNKA